jgi:TonB family protein
MNLNHLNSAIKQSVVVLTTAFLVIGCNDDKSANNSTSADKDVSADSVATTTETAPVIAKTKKSGKVSTSIAADDAKVEMKMDKMGYYNRTEVLPSYKGGESAMADYITNTIEYPQNAIDNNIEGVVNVQFGVDENGNISNVSTLGNKIGYGLEEEAIRVVSRMPKWTPGQVKGKNVKTWRTLPINYRLEES